MTATQLHGRVWPHASAEILDDLSIIRLDYPLDIVTLHNSEVARLFG